MADNSHITILPDDPTLLTEANRQMLRHPDFLSPYALNAKMEFPLLELDTIENCKKNRQAIRNVCAAANYQGSPLIVGAPGVDEIHLPSLFAPIAGLAKTAAQVAKEIGILGKKCIVFMPKYEKRPMLHPFWHSDPGTALLICSSDASTVFALPNPKENQDGQGFHLSNCHQYSPQTGLPVAFGGVIHTQPYGGTQDIDRPSSGMVIFFYLTAGERDVDINNASPVLRKAYLAALNKPS